MNVFELPVQDDEDNLKSEPYGEDITAHEKHLIFSSKSDEQVKEIHSKRPPGVPDKDQIDEINAMEKKRRLTGPSTI
jgi:hypothetical protein